MDLPGWGRGIDVPEPQADKPPPIAAVVGTETFLVRQATRSLLEAVLGPDPDPLAITDLEAAQADPAEVFDELRTLPFLGARRVVILRQADPFVSQQRQALERYAENPAATGTLILQCKSLPANTRLHKRIAKIGQVIKCDAPRRRTIDAWIAQRCREEYGRRIEPPAIARLRDLVGDTLALLDNELAKLTTYASGDRSIRLTDVQELVGVHREETVFGIVDAMLTGDTAGAISLWQQVWATDRAAPARALGGLAWAVRQTVHAKASLLAGESIAEVARRVWTDPAHLEARLSGFSLADLERLLAKLRDADLAVKTGAGSVRDAVERLIIHTAQQKQTGAPKAISV